MWLRISLAALLAVAMATTAEAARYAIVQADGLVQTVVEHNGDPALIIVPAGGSAVLVGEGDRAESGGTYSGGVFVPRPLRNEDIIGQRLDAAIDSNKTFLAITSPTAAQVLTQTQALTRQMNGVLRLMRNRTESVD